MSVMVGSIAGFGSASTDTVGMGATGGTAGVGATIGGWGAATTTVMVAGAAATARPRSVDGRSMIATAMPVRIPRPTIATVHSARALLCDEDTVVDRLARTS